jgi:hypothetical protein
LPASEGEAFIEFVTEEVDFDMTRFYAISAMVVRGKRVAGARVLCRDARRPFGPCQAACPRRGLNPIVERQFDAAARDFRER